MIRDAGGNRAFHSSDFVEKSLQALVWDTGESIMGLGLTVKQCHLNMV